MSAHKVNIFKLSASGATGTCDGKHFIADFAKASKTWIVRGSFTEGKRIAIINALKQAIEKS